MEIVRNDRQKRAFCGLFHRFHFNFLFIHLAIEASSEKGLLAVTETFFDSEN